MIFTKDFLFLHVPKTGGMSVTIWLLNNYPGKIYLTVPENTFDHARSNLYFDDIEERLELIAGGRHEVLASAEKIVGRHGFALDSFDKIVATIRHPLAIERSYHSHVRKPRVMKRRGPNYQDVKIAAEGSLSDFIREAGFFGKRPSHVHRYFEIDGVTPPNLVKIRMEHLAEDLQRELGPYLLDRFELEHRNKTPDKMLAEKELSPEDLENLRRKHPFLAREYEI